MRHDGDKPPRGAEILRDKIFLTESISEPSFLKQKEWWKGGEWADLVGELCFSDDPELRHLAWIAWEEWPLRQRLHLYGLQGGLNNPLKVCVNFGSFEVERLLEPSDIELSCGIAPYYLQRWERGMQISESAIYIWGKVKTEWGVVEADTQIPSVPQNSWLREHPIWRVALEWLSRISERVERGAVQQTGRNAERLQATVERRQEALNSPWAAWMEEWTAFPPVAPPVGNTPDPPAGWTWSARGAPAVVRGLERRRLLMKWIETGDGPPPWQDQ